MNGFRVWGTVEAVEIVLLIYIAWSSYLITAEEISGIFIRQTGLHEPFLICSNMGAYPVSPDAHRCLITPHGIWYNRIECAGHKGCQCQ